MPWLTWEDDEVGCFHQEFESAANEALLVSGYHTTLEWVHHLQTPANPLIPDFVLRRRTGNDWVIALEIKRAREAVFSTRNQIQAKSYAESNQNLYSPITPKYFAISNLERTVLFAMNGNLPPNECRLANGLFISGDFALNGRAEHRQNFINHMVDIINIVTLPQQPLYDTVWPKIIADFLTFANNLPFTGDIIIAEPDTPNWSLVRDFFCSPLQLDSDRLFILRCLMAEYIRGLLLKHNHPRANIIPPIQANQALISSANSLDALRQIDFHSMFEATAPIIYRNINNAAISTYLRDYVQSITRPGNKVVDMAVERIDSPELIDSLLNGLYPLELQDERGKITTDPELALILAYLTITNRTESVSDPCCGDGILLSAAYDRLRSLGANNSEALARISGIEADPIATRLACIRLVLKQPSIISTQPEINIKQGDTFESLVEMEEVNVILMNPPFKRYEAQDLRPVPKQLKEHYYNAIQRIDGVHPHTIAGQANLFNYYIEFITKAIPLGTNVGVILDNKWYHNKYCMALRQLLLNNYQIEAIIEYPHSAFFSHWTIATSILIARKVATIEENHFVKLVRCKVDPRSVDLHRLVSAFHENGAWPNDWTCQTKLQTELDAKLGWKVFFSNELLNNFRRDDWPTIDGLFSFSRRGSLDKEGGGISVFEFPFGRSDYGPRRSAKAPRRRFETEEDRPLTAIENRRLQRLSDQIPFDFRGWSIRNADNLEHYDLTIGDVTIQQVLEPPSIRALNQRFRRNRRTPWAAYHDQALREMHRQNEVHNYITEIENTVNLVAGVLNRDEIWNVLREPIAGELIIPRKTRSGHRVHINSFAFDLTRRQVRLSSNFITYWGCIAYDPESGLDNITSVRLIAAFLVSSFGQLQFEMEGYNREGLLALEKHHLNKIRIFDPRWIRQERRADILRVFERLPYPIATDRLSPAQTERNQLDSLFAQEIVARFPEFELDGLLTEVHNALDEWLISRQP